MALMVYNKDIVEILALSLLRHTEMYAYSIMKQISELTNNAIEVPGGTLYPILYKLQEKGYITDRIEMVGKRKRMARIYYSLTPLGQEHLLKLLEENSVIQLAVQQIVFSAGKEEVK